MRVQEDVYISFREAWDGRRGGRHCVVKCSVVRRASSVECVVKECVVRRHGLW